MNNLCSYLFFTLILVSFISKLNGQIVVNTSEITPQQVNPLTNRCNFAITLVVNHSVRLAQSDIDYGTFPNFYNIHVSVYDALDYPLDRQLLYLTFQTNSNVSGASVSFVLGSMPTEVGPIYCYPLREYTIITPVPYGTVYNEDKYYQVTLLDIVFNASNSNNTYAPLIECSVPVDGVLCFINRVHTEAINKVLYEIKLMLVPPVSPLPSMFSVIINTVPSSTNTLSFGIKNLFNVATTLLERTTSTHYSFVPSYLDKKLVQSNPYDTLEFLSMYTAQDVNSAFFSKYLEWGPMKRALQSNRSTLYIQTHDKAQFEYDESYCDFECVSIYKPMMDYQVLNLSTVITPFSSIIYDKSGNLPTKILHVVFGSTLNIGYSLNYNIVGNRVFELYTPLKNPTRSTSNFYSISIPMLEEYQGVASLNLFNGIGKDVPIVSNGLASSNITIHKINLLSITDLEYIISINVSSVYPILDILIDPIKTIQLSSLVDGIPTAGLYETIIPKKYDPSSISITVRDNALNIVKILPGQIYNPQTMETLPFLNQTIFDITSIKNITFSVNSFTFNQNPNTPKPPKKNAFLYLGFKNSTIDSLKPVLLLEQTKQLFSGYFNYQLRQYVIPFSITPTMLAGSIHYSIYDDSYGFFTFESLPIISYLGQGANITIQNLYGDLFPPILTNLVADPSTSITFNGTGDLILQWNLTIHDIQSGFDVGTVELYSDLDPRPFKKNIISLDRISGDRYLGVYRLTFNVGTACATQTYFLKNLILSDTFDYLILDIKDALIYTIGKEFENETKISVTCTNATLVLDNVVPAIDYFYFTPNIINTFYNSLITFFLSVTDENGIYKKPYIVLTQDIGDPLVYYFDLISKSGNSSKYSVNVGIPYGLSSKFLLVNLYGIVDNSYNYFGMSAMDLKLANYQYIINTTYTPYMAPMITNYIELSYLGGSLQLFGRYFGTDPNQLRVFIDKIDTKGYKEYKVEYTSGGFIKTEDIGPSYTMSSLVSAYVMRLDSSLNSTVTTIFFKNDKSFLPTQTPTETSTPTVTSTPTNQCLGTPPCNNRGICKLSGCECNYPYYGPSCSSEIIPIKPPSPNPDPTINTNIVGNKIITNIQIAEVREVDELDNIIKRFNISQWKLKVDNTNNPTFYYQSQLNGSISTNINVSIIYFNNQTIIEFGNTNLTMEPSSIKYTIDVSKYNFEKKTNQLQIVMDATIKGNDGDSCSSKQFGSNTNSKDNIQWIKINIDKTSLYGRFIDFGIIDGRQQSISNKLLEDNGYESDSKQFRSIKVGMTISYYEESVFIDPDFSNLVDVKDDDSIDYLCSEKKKLSSGAIAGIVVGCVIFISISVAVTIYLLKQSKRKQEQRVISQKLKKLKD